MKKLMTIIVTATLIPVALVAQEITAGEPAGAVFFQKSVIDRDVTVKLGGIGQTVEFVSMEMASAGRTVKGAPYAAEAITEMVQTLADGNRITNRQTAQLYRDSEGRTRRQDRMSAMGKGIETVLINDPVAGVHYVVNPETKTARKMTLPTAVAGSTSGVMMRRSPMPAGATAGAHIEYRASAMSTARPKVEPLGKRVIEGVEAEGVRTTMTIPAGDIGNERPIEIVTEKWFSNELQMVVLTRTSDPRSGETTYRISGLQRGEQMRSLFDVPADYTVQEGEAGMFKKILIDDEKK